MTQKIKTKFGNASLNWQNHYKITSIKEGNYGKFLHRLIYQDYYKVTVMDYAVVHHIDGNPLNNNITNLTLLSRSEHTKLHKKGKPQTQEHINNKIKNKTGIDKLYIQHKRLPIKEIVFAYRFKSSNGNYKTITSLNLEKLYNKITSRGLDWIILDYDKAVKTCKYNGYILKGEKPVKI